MVATGQADIYPRLAPTMEWDGTAAADAIVRESGKMTYQFHSKFNIENPKVEKPVVYNKVDLLNPWFVVIDTKTKKPRSEFSRNVLTHDRYNYSTSNSIAISPILTRIYTPEDYGILLFFLLLLLILGSISNGRYELAIMLPKRRRCYKHLCFRFIIVSCLSLFLLILVLLFNDYFATTWK